MKKVPSSTDKKPEIKTLKSLRKHLQWALEVEHFTIPPYLCALYSIPDGENPEAAELIQSVVMEEMLHMTLVANLMNAVGASPIIDKPGFIPKYPRQMPHSGRKLIVSLEKFSKSAIGTFMDIELPEKSDALPQADQYDTIAQLYEAVEIGLVYLCNKCGPDKVFSGKEHEYKQVTPKHYYGGGGFVFTINNLELAKRAIDEVKEQGEGNPKSKKKIGSIFDGDAKFGQAPEPAHYYRFNEVLQGQKYKLRDTSESGPSGKKFKVNWSSRYNMQKNPKSKKYKPGSEIRQKMDDFNRTYTHLLRMLHKAFNGEPHLLKEAVGQMYQLKYKAIELMRIPSGKGKTTVGPSFEYYPG